MESILTKIFPVKKELLSKGDEILKRVDQGSLTPAKANLALSDLLCVEMVKNLEEEGPLCASVWLKQAGHGPAKLAGFESKEGSTIGKEELSPSFSERVFSAGRPFLSQTGEKFFGMAQETIESSESRFQQVVAIPIEKAGEPLGLLMCFFNRTLQETDLGGLLRLADHLGSLLLTGSDGLADQE